jgi:hypothetical protein
MMLESDASPTLEGTRILPGAGHGHDNLRVLRLFSSVLIALFCGVSAASAVTLSWSTVTWTAGSLSNSYDVDPSNPGNDITITVSGNTGNLGGTSPSIGSNLGGTGRASWQLAPTFTLASQTLTVTIAFNYTQGVYVQNLNILSVDSQLFSDKITNIQGKTATGQTVNAVAVVGSSKNSVTGSSSTGWTVTGTGNAGTAATGNVSVSFGNFRVTQISFTLANSGTLSVAQKIGLDDISWSLTPEVRPGIAASILCGLALIARIRARRKLNASRAPP